MISIEYGVLTWGLSKLCEIENGSMGAIDLIKIFS